MLREPPSILFMDLFFNSGAAIYIMEDFTCFIIDYIEKTEIHGIKGWIGQLSEYTWDPDYSQMLQTSKTFRDKTHAVLNTPNNPEPWRLHCNEIAKWGKMHEVSPKLAAKFQESVKYLLSRNPNVSREIKALPVCGKRIATASKIYYFADPLQWTIYDSRVGYAVHQLIFEYAKKQNVSPSLLFSEIPLCLPESQTQRRNPVYPIPRCQYSERKSKASFIWASHLHRSIACKLNESEIERPTSSISQDRKWELPHVEMVFFVIGDRKWIDAPDI